jgi:large subunit ribosomal protein L21
MYAILSHGGRQYRVSAGDRLVVDRLDAAVGTVVALEPVLLTGGDGKTAFGKDLDGLRVAVTVIAHRRGEKLRIFKYKAKKRSRKVAGHRSDLTELRVESILAKGAALPDASATTQPSGAAAVDAPARKPARGAAQAAAKSSTAASDDAVTATAPTKPAAGAAPRPSAAAKPTAPSATAKAASRPGPKASTKPDPAAEAETVTKPARKRSGKGTAAAGDKEAGDGA